MAVCLSLWSMGLSAMPPAGDPEQGKAAAENVVEKARLAVELAGTGFGEEEREVFYRVLAIIAGNLHKLCRDGLNQNTKERI